MKERLSLTVLKNIEKLPSFGYKLVPEHVETRSLYNDMQPGLEQVGRSRTAGFAALLTEIFLYLLGQTADVG